MKEIPVLLYHNIGDYPETMMEDGITLASFERQMKFLYDNNFNIVSIEQALEHLNKKIKLPPNSIAITIDGGYQDAMQTIPILKEFNFHATYFFVPEFIGKSNTIKGEQIECLTWDETDEIKNQGMGVGFFAYGGRSIRMGYDDATVKNSITEALKILKNRMNSEIRYCAFKEGVPKNPLWKFIQKQGFDAVFTQCPTRCGVSNQGIGRIQIDDDDHNIFLTKISQTYLFFKDKTIWKYLRKYKLDRVAHFISDTWNWIKRDGKAQPVSSSGELKS